MNNQFKKMIAIFHQISTIKLNNKTYTHIAIMAKYRNDSGK